ncbi:GyrI-like domain-containing protein [Membranihabitans maritimus]|uniref:GyrI-like domain-containing protein n=1 Tax=Membranihabitans maritimus TaxID=2904244 RepID=UPI001F235E3F|nr:effector binding domain-containing protein [Membranihabitans maritimus]
MKKKSLFLPERIETNIGPLLMAGFSKKYAFGSSLNTEDLCFGSMPLSNQIPGKINNFVYRLTFDTDPWIKMECFCGVEVQSLERLPAPLTYKLLNRNNYAVFYHIGHISTMRRTFDLIKNQWFPESYPSLIGSVNYFFERYGEGYNKEKGIGDIEIWVPLI